MRKNQTRARLTRGEPAIGAWLQLNSPLASRMLAAQGCFDWLVLDWEHVPYDYPTAAQIMASIADISQGQVTPLIRVPSAAGDHIKAALDCGAHGVIVPMVNTAADVESIVRASYFPPVGERGGGGVTPHLCFGTNRPQYMAHVNSEILVGIQVETQMAVDNIEAIAQVPGLGMVFIGPNDLHMSLGLPGSFWSEEPRFLACVRTVVSACRKHGVPVGIICRDAKAVKARMADGFTFIAMGTDAQFLLTRAGQLFGELHGKPEPAEGWLHFLNQS